MKTTKFKNSEIGPIPEEWEVKRLGDCGQAIRGVSFKPEQSSLQQSVGKTMLLRSNNIQNDTLNYDDVLFVDDTCIGEAQYMRVGDILICAANGSRNLVGKSASFKDAERVTFGAFMAVFRPNGAVDAGLVGYLLQSASYHRQLDDILTGSAINNLNAKDIENLSFMLPSTRAEQEAIAGALADVDELLAAMTTLIEKKRAIKQGAMQELLEVRSEECGVRSAPRRRLAGFTGAWVEKRLGDCGRFSKGAGISRAQANTGKIPAVRYGELYTTHNDYIKQFESFISEEVAQASVRLNRGDIVFACSGEAKEEIGKCAAFLGDEVAYAGGDLIIFSPDNEYDSLFLGFALNTPYCASQKAAAGQGDAVVHIRRDSLEELVVRIPPTLAEQKAIAGVLADMDAEIAALEAKRAKCEQVKQGMMQELLTGKTRLKGE